MASSRPSSLRAPAGDHAVAGDLLFGHAEIDRTVFDEHVELLKRLLVQEQGNAFARGELAAGMLSSDALIAAAEPGFAPLVFKLLQYFLHMSAVLDRLFC